MREWPDLSWGPLNRFLCLSFPMCPGPGRQMRGRGAGKQVTAAPGDAGKGRQVGRGLEGEGRALGAAATAFPTLQPRLGSRCPEAPSSTSAGSRPHPRSPPAPPPTPAPPRPRPSPPRPAARLAPSPAMKKLWVKKRFQVRAPGAGGAGRGQEGLGDLEGGRVTAAGPRGRGAGVEPTPPRPPRPLAGRGPGGSWIRGLSVQPLSPPLPVRKSSPPHRLHYPRPPGEVSETPLAWRAHWLLGHLVASSL